MKEKRPWLRICTVLSPGKWGPTEFRLIPRPLEEGNFNKSQLHPDYRSRCKWTFTAALGVINSCMQGEFLWERSSCRAGWAPEEQPECREVSGLWHAEQACPPTPLHQVMELQPVCQDDFWQLQRASREFFLKCLNPGINSKPRNIRKPVPWVHTEHSFFLPHMQCVKHMGLNNRASIAKGREEQKAEIRVC